MIVGSGRLPRVPIYSANSSKIPQVCIKLCSYPPLINQKHPPKGLYALILEAVHLFLLVMVKESYTYFLKVEQGFSAHLYTSPPHFNYDNCWKPLGDFFKNINKIKEDRWAMLLQVRSNNERDQDDMASDGDSVHGDQSMISAYCAEMYVPSSPIKL